MSIFGNPVMMGGSGGGGGGDVPLLTRAQWDALSTAQKQAYGLVAIKDANSGFDRGELVYGADLISEFDLYDHGTEGVNWTAGHGATKNADNISLLTPGGTLTNYAITAVPVDVTYFATLEITYSRTGVESTQSFDLSTYSGLFYISFVYESTSSYGRGCVGLNANSAAAYTFELWRAYSVAQGYEMYKLALKN